MTAALTPGAVFVGDFHEHDPSGQEQAGLRPAVLVGLPTNAGRPGFPGLLLAPITTVRALTRHPRWRAVAAIVSVLVSPSP